MTENSPTTTDEQHGQMNRRNFLRTIGAAGAAGATGVSVSGPAAGEVAVPDTPVSFDAVTFDPMDVTSRFDIIYGQPIGVGLLSKTLKVFGSDSGDASAGDITFHDTALSAFSSWENTYTLIKNYLKDLPTTMNVRARSAVADAYDAGKTQSEAQQSVADAVYARADTAARNAVVAKMTLAIQLANISATAANTSNVLDIWQNTFFGVSSSSYSGSGTQVPSETGIVETEVTESITLPSGDTTEIESVKFEIGWDNGDGATFTVSDLLSNYNPSSGPYGEYSLTTNNGNTLTDDFTGTVPSLPDENLASRRCINMAQLGDIYDEIESKASTVIGNYGATFVGDIYSALDNGTITTGQLRGVEGLASLLSGSTDATESRYQLALSTLYDIPRPDLSEASFMEVELDGWTDESIRVDTDGNRSRILENRTKKPIPYRGQLFAQNVSTDLKAGETYLFDVPIMTSSEDNTVALLDSGDGSVIWQNSSVHSDDVRGAATVGSERIVTGSHDNTVALLDSADGSVIWQNSSAFSTKVRSATAVDSDRVTAGAYASVALLDSTGDSVIWQNSNVHSDAVISLASVGSDSVASCSFDDTVALLDLADGSVIWQNSSVHSDSVLFVVSLGSDMVVSCSLDNTVALLDSADGSVIWQNSSVHSGAVLSAAPLGSDRVLTGSQDNTVALLDSADGSVIWQTSDELSSKVWSLEPVGSDRVAVSSGSTVALLDSADGSVIWKNSSVHSDNIRSVAPLLSYQNYIQRDQQTYFETYDGSVTNGFFGGVNLATDSDEFEEVPIRGTMKILSMQDADGNSVDQINTDPSDPDTTYGPPEYEQLNNTELANRLDKIEKQLADALDEAGNEQTDVGLPSIDGPGNFLDDLPSLPGFSTLESIVMVGFGAWVAGQLSN